MHTCPTCNGTKKQTITSKTFVEGKGFISDPPVTIDCIICDGVGEIDDETLQQIEFEKNLWCKCAKSSGSYYVPDGKGIISKHHYLCFDCDKVTQIG